MLAIQQGRQRAVDRETDQDNPSSPLKTVLGSLATGPTKHHVTIRTQTDTQTDKIPTRIEEVPFRRQDRRTLNARNRRLMDAKLIIFIVMTGLVLVGIGSGLLVVYIFYQEEFKHIRPVIVIGPVLIGGGVVTILCSVEVCVRLYRSKKRVQDPDLDSLDNPHEVKHWVEPAIIPYGWGLFEDDDEVLVIEREETVESPVGGGRLRTGQSSIVHPASHMDNVSNNTREEEVNMTRGRADSLLTDSPHRLMMALSDEDESIDDESFDMSERPKTDPLLSSDIYSKSLRFSHISRPELLIDRSSPVKQKRGDFVDQEEKIANLFNVTKKRTKSANS